MKILLNLFLIFFLNKAHALNPILGALILSGGETTDQSQENSFYVKPKPRKFKLNFKREKRTKTTVLTKEKEKYMRKNACYFKRNEERDDIVLDEHSILVRIKGTCPIYLCKGKYYSTNKTKLCQKYETKPMPKGWKKFIKYGEIIEKIDETKCISSGADGVEICVKNNNFTIYTNR